MRIQINVKREQDGSTTYSFVMDEEVVTCKPATLGIMPKKVLVHKPLEESRETNEEEIAEIDKVMESRSSCCQGSITVAGDDEGTNHYECMKCGDPCDIWTEEIEAQKRAARTIKGHACCGSKGRRHKKGCTGSGVEKSEDSVEYVCDDCQKTFKGKSGTEKTCPACDSSNVWPAT